MRQHWIMIECPHCHEHGYYDTGKPMACDACGEAIDCNVK